MLVKFIRYWLPPILWMAFIFFLSSNHRVTITRTYAIDFIIFKTLHMIEYAILYFLLFRGFYSIKNKSLSQNQRFFYPFILAVAYAFTDEFHQLFTPTREGRIRDVGIDTIGIFIMFSYIKVHLKLFKKFI